MNTTQQHNDPATVAVIVPTYNRAQFLTQALDSIFRQTRPANQVIVMDDGSTDDTCSVVARYGNTVTYLHQENAGKAVALNTAIAATDTDYILILDDDDVLIPEALRWHIEHLMHDRSAGFTYSGCYLFDGKTPPDTPERLAVYDAVDVNPSDFFRRCLETFPFHTQGMLVKRDSYAAVGPYNAELAFGQDYEMILRLARYYPGIRIDEPTFMLRIHDGDRGPAHLRQTARNREQAWRVYERKTFMQLRHELPLNDYLPRSNADVIDRGHRQAYLQRACIMARHGLFSETLEDLRTALDSVAAGEPISNDERLICSRMMDLEPALLQNEQAWLKQLRRTLLKHPPQILDACTAGLYWSYKREKRNGSYKGALVLTLALIKLSGIRLPLLAFKKSGGRFLNMCSQRKRDRNAASIRRFDRTDNE